MKKWINEMWLNNHFRVEFRPMMPARRRVIFGTTCIAKKQWWNGAKMGLV